MSRSLLKFLAVFSVVPVFFGLAASSACAAITGWDIVAPTAASTAAPKLSDKPDVDEVRRTIQAHPSYDPLPELHRAANRHPEIPSEYVLMYYVYSQPGEAKRARSWLEKAIVATPEDPEPWAISGELALKENRVGEANLDFAKAKQLLAMYHDEPRKRIVEPLVLIGMAGVFERRQQWAEAQSRLEEYLKKAPENIAVLQRLARAIFWQQKPKESYDVLKRAEEIDKRNAEKNHTPAQMLPAAAIMAQFYEEYERAVPIARNGHSDNPLNWFKYAVTKNPDDLNLRATVAEWALENGQLAFAKEQADAVRPNTIGLTISGNVALWEKQWADAEVFFEKALAAAPASFVAKNGLALALVEQNDPAKKLRALQYAEENLKQDPNNAAALSTLAWVHVRREELDLAAEDLDKFDKAIDRCAGEADPGAMDSERLLLRDAKTCKALVLFHQGNKLEAKKLLRELHASGQSFSLRPEAEQLYKKVKNEPNSDAEPDKAR